jgi:cell division protein FtsW
MPRQTIVAERNKMPERVDIPFVLLVLLLCGIGFTVLYSGSMGYASRIFDDPLYFLKKQGANFIIGVLAMVLFSSINLDMVRMQLPKIVLVTLLVSLLPFIPGLGVMKNGATRWIAIKSFTFQPSELVKMVVVFYLASLFAKKFDKLDQPMVTLMPATVTSLILVATVYFQNDFSKSLFIILVVLVMFFIAGVDWKWFVRLLLCVLPLVALMVLTKTYRVERVLSFLHPEHDPLGSGYQVNAALDALRDGGFWGRGLGNGIRKISSIPEVQSDFIFAVWGEEMGFIGVCVYFALLIAFALRGFAVSLRCQDRFRCFLGFGCTTVIFLQSLMNCGVVVRLFPATGVPLPFFSSGGSSLLITLCLCGFIINVSRWKPEGEVKNV